MTDTLSLAAPLDVWRDRWDGGTDGYIVLDLGEQPASDHFPSPDAPGPDPKYLLRIVLSASSGLIQLEDDQTTAAEQIVVESAVLIRQGELCVSDAEAAGYVRAGGTVLEYPSPHGGTWEKPLAAGGMVNVKDGRVDLVADVHGMMHDADQRAAFLDRLSHLNDDGVLLMMIHNCTSVVRNGMWNTLKHGHFAYYSTPALVKMADEIGLVTIGAWSYALYNNGTTMLAFARRGSRWGDQPDTVTALVEEELAEGITDPARVASLGRAFTESVAAIRGYLDDTRRQGLLVAGYGAASRTSALLCSAEVSTDDMAVIADASVPKHGLSMPVNRIPIVSPADLVAARPDRVLLFVPDLLPEVRAALPEIEANGGRWVVMDPMPREIEPLA